MDHRTTALIVDDEPSVRRLIEVLLTLRGYRTITIGCGADVVAVARAERPDVIVLDHGLPDVDGLDVLAALKADPQVRSVPAVVVTGWHDEELEQRALQAGAFGAVGKPFRGDALADLVDEAVIRDRRGELTRTPIR